MSVIVLRFDFSPFGRRPLVPFFVYIAPLRNLAVFHNFTLDGWTVTWQDGSIDIAPEYLYEHGATV